MLNEFSRTELLIGKKALLKLARSKVAVFGIGGVGTFAVEGLVRAGVGGFVLVDDDCVCLTNINRQIHATRKTIGRPKVEAMKDRILEINPAVEVAAFQTFYMPEQAQELIRPDYDYIVDAIDTVTAKIDLIVNAKKQDIPVISSMGAGNKLDPAKLKIADIYDTTICPLARVMRRELRKRGVTALKVVYSQEEPLKPLDTEESSCQVNCICPKGTTRSCTVRRQIPGSISFVPSVAGLLIASEVIKDLIT
ncbi:tRNA threonylcarbamoyladenosine dehydratase [Pelotomaculum propionicicum]|uniref:tRNA threonylcarbamoyladenosine dehydratase n=1 Tax=Pelotomaculum propionicicum TaxID=258475 RepID=A0A4Y7RW45_9FIRM|nr:tRNA threonylcarbamoyladenosine dehydratase [Pelotomaculum propionicicum]TEB12949.1 tRNA threonylcarbamoyladenosine dehydratase [Pelotomaculum propionicicum]